MNGLAGWNDGGRDSLMRAHGVDPLVPVKIRIKPETPGMQENGT